MQITYTVVMTGTQAVQKPSMGRELKCTALVEICNNRSVNTRSFSKRKCTLSCIVPDTFTRSFTEMFGSVQTINQGTQSIVTSHSEYWQTKIDWLYTKKKEITRNENVDEYAKHGLSSSIRWPWISPGDRKIIGTDNTRNTREKDSEQRGLLEKGPKNLLNWIGSDQYKYRATYWTLSIHSAPEPHLDVDKVS